MMMPFSAAKRGGEGVDFQGPGAHLLGQFKADAFDDDIEADVFVVVAGRRFGAGRENGFGQFLGQLQAVGQFDAADGAGGLVVLPARADDVAAGDGFHRQRLELLGHHRTPGVQVKFSAVRQGRCHAIRRSDGSGTDARSCANQKLDIWHSISPLPGIGSGSTTSKADRRSDRDHQQPVAGQFIDIADLAAMQQGQG